MELLLIRHADPDRTLADIIYDEPPGPPLSAFGHTQAAALVGFLAARPIARILSSPFVRASETAAAIATARGLPVEIDARLGEWHASETASQVVARVQPVLDGLVGSAPPAGAVCLVSHGGTIGVLLRKLGMPREQVDRQRARYGGLTPSPTSGVWAVQWGGGGSTEFLQIYDPPETASSAH